MPRNGGCGRAFGGGEATGGADLVCGFEESVHEAADVAAEDASGFDAVGFRGVEGDFGGQVELGEGQVSGGQGGV